MEMNCENELPLHIHDKNNGLDYTLHGDYYLPDIGGQSWPAHWKVWQSPTAVSARASLNYL